MHYRELSIAGAWEATPRVHADARGLFVESFQASTLADHVGHGLTVRQVNRSSSAAGVVRGIHFAAVPPGQAKYVTCTRGAVVDYAVDLRLGSPTFGTWDTVLLDDAAHRSVYLPEGLGHMFVSLADDSTVVYLCSQPYAPVREFAVNPFCPALGIAVPTHGRDGAALELQLSDKDREAPDLHEAERRGILPTFTAQQDYVQSLRAEA